MITVAADSGIETVEKLLARIHSGPSQSLKLPISVAYGGGFGLSPLLSGCVAAWARLHEGRRQLSLPQEFLTNEATTERFASTLHGMAALYFADETVAGGQTLSKFDALTRAKPYVDAMAAGEYSRTTKGPAVLLACFQGAQSEFLRSLYAYQQRGTPGSSTVRSISEFEALFTKLGETIGLKSSFLSKGRTELFGELLFQLFNNADIHTVVNPRTGDAYPVGVRGILVRKILAPDVGSLSTSLSGVTGANDRAFAGYLMRLGSATSTPGGVAQAKRGKETQAFLELSVFDTGPGLGLSWMHKKHGSVDYADFDVDSEFEAVKDCFAKHLVRSSSSFQDRGLQFVLQALGRLDGFMSLRTGRLSLYQDFSKITRGVSDASFAPTRRWRQKELKEMPGTHYSLFVPV